MYTPSIFIKHIVLSFLQEVFKEDPKYTWNKDPRFTGIIIADKHAMEMGVAAKRPSIILDRGDIGWTMNYRNDPIPRTPHVNKTFTAESGNNHSLRDLMRGSVNLNIIHKLPFQADEIANLVFWHISGRREMLKEKGIHKYTGLSIGREGIVKAKSDIEVSAVAVQFSFIWEQTIHIGERLFNARVYVNDNEVYENVHFIIKEGGTQIEFQNPLKEEDEPTIDYIDAITLEQVENKNLIPVDGSNTLYVVPDNGVIFGFYKILEDIWVEM